MSVETTLGRLDALKPRFVVEGLGDFLAREIKPREQILAPWLPEQGLAMIYAPRGVGKTFVALNIAYAVASAGTFLKWNAPKPRRVLLIDGEMPSIVLQERLADIGVTSPEPKATFSLLMQDSQPLGAPNLADLRHQEALQPYLDGIHLIVLDNVSTLVRTSRAENDAESWVAVQGWMLEQRAASRSVLLIHHSGKGGAQRGTSKREDILDTVINLRHPRDYDPADGAVFEVSYEKARGFYGDEAKPFKATLVDGSWTCADLEESTYESVVAMMKDDVPQADIARELDVNRSTVSRHVKQAKEKGDLT